jgi:arabinogalactan endo-1,4-beta-galactosidase
MGGAGGGAQFEPPFILGADISSVQESQSTFRDTDGQTKTIFAVLKHHGFNYIRLKTFVDPSAPYGYASTANGCTGFPEPFGDRDHVVAFGKQAKDAGMGFLLNFHYSDVWADPGNQIIPAAWRDATTLTELASRVKAYTKDVITTAVAAGARPDMVQVGNEITPGMLAHVPGSNTDCWGNNPAAAPAAISGSITNWNNFTTLLKAGIEGVREVDPEIQIMLHIENTDDLNGVRSWLDNVLMRDVEFDVLGLSCYVAFQGQPSVWQSTFSSLATNYPDLKFAIAEYNPERTQANLMMKNLPDGRGLGTFFWEPTRSGEWGNSLFTWQNNVATANSADFQEYDEMRAELGL